MGVGTSIILGLLLAYMMWKNDHNGEENDEKERLYQEKRDDGPWFF